MSEVTVIIPAYNAELYIKECLQSLYEQTFKDIDVLVINDSSSDNTVQVVKHFICTHTEFKLKLITVPNGGAAKARNIGIKKASGKYIAFIDADDIIDKTMLQKMVTKAEEIDADLVTCDFYWAYSNHLQRQNLEFVESDIDLFKFAWAAPWNKLYRKTMLIENEIYFTEGFTFEDTSFYLKYIPFCHKITHIAEPFIYWRQHNSSTMRGNQSKRIPQIFPVLEDAITFYKKHGQYQRYNKELEFFCVKLLWGSSMYRICQVRNKSERQEYIKMTLEWLKKYFPDWKRNQYFKSGLRGIYIKTLNIITANIYSNLIYYIRYYGRNRM